MANDFIKTNTKFLPIDTKELSKKTLLEIGNSITSIGIHIDHLRDDEILCVLGANANRLKRILDNFESFQK